MNVPFAQERDNARYRVSVEGPVCCVFVDGAGPGYDVASPRHGPLVVENELGIAGGYSANLLPVACTYVSSTDEKAVVGRPAGKANSVTNRGDALLSEKVVYIACRAWNNGLLEAKRLKAYGQGFTRVCRVFDQ